MDEVAVRAALEHYIRHSGAGDEDTASEIYHEDAILEFPQSGERFEGVGNFRGPWNHGPAIYEFRGDEVSRETIHVRATWEPPDWRAQWQAAPPP